MPKVLICDDSLSVRKVAERLLLAAGFDVALAANGEEALASLTAGRPDIIIADVIMPDKSGFEVCAHVRAHATLSMTPVLLISGVVDDEITRQAVLCHADGVIKKPFHGTSLPDRVFALLASRQEPPAAAPPVSADMAKTDESAKTPESTEAAWGPKVFRITEDQLEKVRDVATWAKDVEARLSAEQKRGAELEEQNSAFRETALSAAVRIRQLEANLAEEQERSAILLQRLTEMEQQLTEEQKRSGVLLQRIEEIEQQLAEEQKQSATLLQRIAEMEPAASCTQKLAEIMAEIGRLGPKPEA